MIFLCVLQFEKFGASLDVIEVGVRERDDIEVVAISSFQILFEARFSD